MLTATTDKELVLSRTITEQWDQYWSHRVGKMQPELGPFLNETMPMGAEEETALNLKPTVDAVRYVHPNLGSHFFMVAETDSELKFLGMYLKQRNRK